MMKMQFGVSKCSQILDAANTCDVGFTQFEIKTEQVGFYRVGNNPDLVNI